MKRGEPPKRSTYRALRSDEPDPPGDPLVYNTSDGRVMKRWKIAQRTYVERVVRDDEGRPVRSRPMGAKRIDRVRALRLYEGGLTMTAVAEELGCSEPAVSRALRSMGITARPNETGRPFDADAAVARYKAGDGFKTIARDMGVSASRVKDALRFRGVRLRGAGRVKGVGRGPDKRLAYDTEFQAMRPHVRARSGGRCEAQVSPRCTHVASHVHHRQMRSQGGPNTLENLLDVCSRCHSHIHANPGQSYASGLLLHRAPMVDPL